MSQAELLNSERRTRTFKRDRPVVVVPASTPAVRRIRPEFQEDKIDADLFLVDRIRPYPEWPLICRYANLPAFETEAAAMKWNDGNGHLPILAKWTCSVCWLVHYWSTSASDSNGAPKAGADELPERIRELMK